VEALFLAYGFDLCYDLKDIPDKYNESEQSLNVIFLIIFGAVIVFPIMYFLAMSAVDISTIAAIVFAFVLFVSLTMLFALKIVKVYKIVGISVYTRSQKTLMEEDAALVTFPVNIIDDVQKFEYCQKQVQCLSTALIEIGRDDSSHGSGNSSAGKSQSRHSSQEEHIDKAVETA